MNLDNINLGVALSVYNKLDCVRTNVEIIRNYWRSNNDAFISVCCNDPDSISKLEELDIETLVPGSPIPSDTKANRRSRIFDCITKSIDSCGADFIIHYHADAYATSVEPILEIIQQMEEEGKHVAFRGRGIDFRSQKCIHGDIDDHFIIFRRSEMKKRNVFFPLSVNKTQYLAVGNPESLLGRLIELSFDKDEILFYSDMSENIVAPDVRPDDFYSDGIMHRAMNPYNIDKSRGFVHVGDMSLAHGFLSDEGVPEELIKISVPKLQKPVDELNLSPEYIKGWLDE